MNEQLAALVQNAGNAAKHGQWQEAERLWTQVRALDPSHPQALYSLGIHAFQRGDTAAALESLQAAHRVAPSDPMILLSIAVVMRERGDSAGEWKAIGASLVADPYFVAGLLAKGAFLERTHKPRAAAEVYRNALKAAPPEPHWPATLRPQLQAARVLVDRYLNDFADYLASHISGPRAALDSAVAGRWDEAVSIMAGRSRPYHSDCNQLCVPRLPAIPFFGRSQFPWVEALESRTAAIRAELQDLLQEDQGEFSPYVAYKPGDPVNQWKDLNHSRRWSTYRLWDQGKPVAAHLARCPETAAALAAVEMAEIGGLCPNAMFSVLDAHTHIPPHHGETNARVVAHLPLIVPDHCSYRVGFDRRGWREGEVLVFDDSIEHEARNDSDELRAVLIFDVWNPLLSQGEREMVNAMMDAAREFSQDK